LKVIFEEQDMDVAKECGFVAEFLVSHGYLSKCYGVSKKHGAYMRDVGDKRIEVEDWYYVAYYNGSHLLKWFDEKAKFNGLPIFVHPFSSQ